MAPITEPESISNGDAARNHHAVQNGDMRHLPSSNGDIPTAPSIDTPVSTNTHREPLSDLSAVQSEAVSSTLQAASAEADNSASINVPVENAVSAPSRSQEEQAAVTLTSGASPSEQEQSATEPNTGTDEKRPKAAASEPTNERNTSASEKPPMSVLPAMGADALLGLDDLLASVDVYELGNYTFGRKERDSRSFALRARSRVEEQTHLAARHRERGLRRSVAAVVLVHEHRFAHVLLLQRSDGTGDYALPGGRLRPGESDEDGLMRKLRAKLTPDGIEPDQLDISERLCNWYRIDFSHRLYPYIPAHVTKPKEELHVYAVSLPEKFAFSVPKNMQIVAIPLYDLFDNAQSYGNVIAAVPALISRFHINYC